eukprot:3124113-Pleurochrysis_carterae.AAC.1
MRTPAWVFGRTRDADTQRRALLYTQGTRARAFSCVLACWSLVCICVRLSRCALRRACPRVRSDARVLVSAQTR